MKYSEELLWILDGPGSIHDHFDEKVQKNIEFVHSLGLKCDCVGWCNLDLSKPQAPEILSSISAFCRENGWKARCYYTREYTDVQSDWYTLIPSKSNDNTHSDWIKTVTDDGEKTSIFEIRAYHEMNPSPKEEYLQWLVPERFREFCLRNIPDALEFCWARDKGKYAAEQYFHMYAKQLIPQFAKSFDPHLATSKTFAAAGGWLPEISKVFHEIQQVQMPDCYLAKDMPAGGIAYTYIPSRWDIRRHSILIHKTIAQALLEQKILPPSALRPAPVVDELPGGYILKKTSPIPVPNQAFRSQMLAEYEKLKATPRPVRLISEKEALRALRSAKKERKEDFKKAYPRAKAPDLAESAYAPLVPYYLVADGGFLSDEYELLPYAHAVKENADFHKSLEAEELIEEKPDGIVIAKCPDGDTVLLCRDGAIIRFSHEMPEATAQWQSLAQFIVDAIYE